MTRPPVSYEMAAELSMINLADGDLEHVLERICRIVEQTLPGASHVSVTVIGAEGATTAAFTDDVALLLDERQYEEGTGPCLHAATEQTTVEIADMEAEDRWPRFTDDAGNAGVHSSLSVGLSLGQDVYAALNIYAKHPDAFDPDAVALAVAFAGYAAVALGNAFLFTQSTALARQLREAMVSRSIIEQAKGIIMGQRRINADAAFQVLRDISQNSNRKLRDVATELVDSVAAPSPRTGP